MLAIGWQGGKRVFMLGKISCSSSLPWEVAKMMRRRRRRRRCFVSFSSFQQIVDSAAAVTSAASLSSLPNTNLTKKTVFFRQFFTEQNVEMSHSISSAPYMAANIFCAKIMMNYHSQCVADDIKIYSCNLRWSVKSSSSGSIGVDETTTSISVVKWKLSHSDSFFLYTRTAAAVVGALLAQCVAFNVPCSQLY